MGEENTARSEARSVGRIGVLRLILRSFYLQSCWNYESLQALGFGYVLFPVGRRLARAGEVSLEFAKRHLSLFNSNPILASYIIGSVAKMEEEHEAGLRTAAEIEAIKSRLATALAAAGDRLFWATLRPLAGLIGVAAAGIAGAAGCLVLLAVYNVLHVYYRVTGVLRGYALGADVAREVSRMEVMRLSEGLGSVGAFLLGMLFVMAAHGWTASFDRRVLLVFLGVAVASGILPRSFQSRITEVALAAGAVGFLLTSGGILG